MPSLNRQNSAAQWKAKPLEARVTESANIRTSKPGQVPVIVELHKNPGLLPALPRNKYLVSARAPVASLRDAIAQDAQSKWQGKIHLFLLDTTTELDYARPLGKLDQESADADGFLYIAVSSEQKPTKSVPYAKSLLGQADAGSRPSSTSSAASSTESLTSPHGDRLPDGATIASCTFLNPRANGRLLPELRPTGDGRVPASLYLATILDVTAVGLVVPLLATYSRALGAGPRFTGLLQATYGLAQLIGANILGGVSDRVGRRTMLRLSSFGGLMGYASLSYAVGPNGSLPLLLASRLVSTACDRAARNARTRATRTPRGAPPARLCRAPAPLPSLRGPVFNACSCAPLTCAFRPPAPAPRPESVAPAHALAVVARSPSVCSSSRSPSPAHWWRTRPRSGSGCSRWRGWAAASASASSSGRVSAVSSLRSSGCSSLRCSRRASSCCRTWWWRCACPRLRRCR